MANDIDVNVTATEDVSDALGDVASAADRAETVIVQSMGSSEEAFDSAARASGRLGEGLDLASGAASQLSGGIGDVGGAMTAFTDLQGLAQTKALEHEQALLDVENAQDAYNAAVKEFGSESKEARQASLDLKAAQMAAEPPTKIAEWGEKLELISPIIMGVVGATDLAILANSALNMSMIKNAATLVATKTAMVATTVATGIATAAQWAWNVAMTANPIGLIIAAVVLLIGVIVLIATKTTWFQQLWNAIWGAIKDPVMFVANFIWSYWVFVFNALKTAVMVVKDAIVFAFRFAVDFVVAYFKFIFSLPGKVISVFASIGNAIAAPFKAGFNAIARFWNSTVGRLSFSLPSWIPGIGGLGFSMPKLPQLATGGDITRTGMAIVHAGERVVPARAVATGGGGGGGTLELRIPTGNDPRIAIAELAAWAIRSGYLDLVVNNVPVRVAS